MNLKPVVSKFLKENTFKLLETGGSTLIVIESIHHHFSVPLPFFNDKSMLTFLSSFIDKSIMQTFVNTRN